MLDKIEKILAIAFRYELHAFLLLLTGIAAYMHGLHDQGAAIIAASMTIFKGKTNA
jgi:hypothetical protein